jgi:hypothetical protein
MQNTNAGGTSGAKVVLAMAAMTLTIALVVLAAFFLISDDSVACVEGEMQDNALGPDGQFMPRTETFATLEEAEAFVCKHIPHPRDTGPLALQHITVTRSHNLGRLIEGIGYTETEFVYTSAQPGVGLTLTVDHPGHAPETGQHATLKLNGVTAEKLPSSNGSEVLVWEKDGYGYGADASLGEGLDSEALLAILESIR